jgi:TetR/AcrR family transcriptional repressor of nem operon
VVGVRQFDEQAVLECALAQFWQHGVAATSMIDLSTATGVQRGSLYNAYGDKEAIFLRAFDLYAARFLEAAEVSLQGDDAGRILRRFFEKIIVSMTAGSPARGCLTTKTVGDGSLASGPVRKRLQEFLDRLVSVVEAALVRPKIRAQLSLEPAQAAMVVVTFTRGVAVMERVYGDRDALLQAADSLIRSLARAGAPARGRRVGNATPKRSAQGT